MKVLHMQQGTPEWHQARLGIPTCSRLDEVLTPKTLKLSTSAGKYRNQLLAEWLVGYPLDFGGSSAFVDRGTEMEPEARAYYELQRDVEVETVGFMLRDDEMMGGSPDGLVGDAGGLEIKCPALHTHIGYLLDPSLLVATYQSQVQGYLYITGREWWDILSYNPDLPDVTVRITRDEAYIAALDVALAGFVADLRSARGRLEPHRTVPPHLYAEANA